MKNNFEKIKLIVAIIFFILLSVALVFLYQLTDGNRQKGQQDYITYQTEKLRHGDLATLNSSLSTIQDEQNSIQTHFAKSSDVVPFLDNMETLAGEVGATASVDSVDAPADNSGLAVNLKASGSFESLYKFLTLLENSPYELNFLGVDFHQLDQSNASGKSVPSAKWEVILKVQLVTFIP